MTALRLPNNSEFRSQAFHKRLTLQAACISRHPYSHARDAAIPMYSSKTKEGQANIHHKNTATHYAGLANGNTAVVVLNDTETLDRCVSGCAKIAPAKRMPAVWDGVHAVL